MPRGNSVDAAVSIEVWARKVRRDRDREERDDIYQTLSTLWWGVLEPDANPYTMAQREIEPHMWINPGSRLLTEMNPVSAECRNRVHLCKESGPGIYPHVGLNLPLSHGVGICIRLKHATTVSKGFGICRLALLCPCPAAPSSPRPLCSLPHPRCCRAACVLRPALPQARPTRMPSPSPTSTARSSRPGPPFATCTARRRGLTRRSSASSSTGGFTPSPLASTSGTSSTCTPPMWRDRKSVV